MPGRVHAAGLAEVRAEALAAGCNQHLTTPVFREEGLAPAFRWLTSHGTQRRLGVDLSFAESGISEDLAISVKTVETYRARLLQKLGIDNMPALMKFAIRAGITSAQP